MAFGPLGLSHQEFWCLTPGELFDLEQGFLDRQKLRQRETAWMICAIANTCGNMKKPLTISQLIKGEPSEVAEKSRDEIMKEIHYLEAKFGEKFGE
jgi:hypothetical protein